MAVLRLDAAFFTAGDVPGEMLDVVVRAATEASRLRLAAPPPLAALRLAGGRGIAGEFDAATGNETAVEAPRLRLAPPLAAVVRRLVTEISSSSDSAGFGELVAGLLRCFLAVSSGARRRRFGLGLALALVVLEGLVLAWLELEVWLLLLLLVEAVVFVMAVLVLVVSL